MSKGKGSRKKLNTAVRCVSKKRGPIAAAKMYQDAVKAVEDCRIENYYKGICLGITLMACGLNEMYWKKSGKQKIPKLFEYIMDSAMDMADDDEYLDACYKYLEEEFGKENINEFLELIFDQARTKMQQNRNDPYLSRYMKRRKANGEECSA